MERLSQSLHLFQVTLALVSKRKKLSISINKILQTALTNQTFEDAG